MRWTALFPILLISMNLAAASVYAWHRDWNPCIYWLAAATLTTCVTLRYG